MATTDKTSTQVRVEQQVETSLEKVERYLRQPLGFRSFDHDTLSLTHANGITQVLSEDMHNVLGAIGGVESTRVDSLVLGAMLGVAMARQGTVPEVLEYGVRIVTAELGSAGATG